MSSARITIGGLDVSPRPGEPVTGVRTAAESQSSTAGVDRTRDGGHAPVILTLENPPRPRCPLPPGPWRIISALTMLGVLLALVAVLCEHRRRAG